MVSSPKSTTGPNKRDFKEYQETQQNTESEESVKKPRLEVPPENVHTFDDLVEDPPENWNEDELFAMWGDLLNDPEPEGGLHFGNKQQQKSDNRPGEGSASITVASNVEHKSMLVEQNVPTLSPAAAAEKPKEPISLNEEKSIPVAEAEYSTREIPTPSARHTVQYASSSTQNTLKPRFPPANIPLPEGISLDRLCRHWPYHLTGRTLRRFIEEGCTAGWIFLRLDHFVRKALDKQGALEKKKGWEVIEQRLDEEKARMAEEAKQAGLQPQKTTSAEASHRPATTFKSATEAIAPQKQREVQQLGARKTPQRPVNSLQKTQRTNLAQAQNSPHLSGLSADSPTTNLRQVSASSSEGLFLQSQEQTSSGGTRGTPQPLPATHIELVNTHQREIEHELAKQSRILQDISDADPSLVHKTPEERLQHRGQHWVDQARSYEKQIGELLDHDVGGIDFQSTRPRDMLVRQRKLIERILIKRAPFPENASTQDTRLHRERVEATTFRQQRDVLRRWTMTLEALLAEVRDSSSRGNQTIATSSGTARSNAAQSEAHRSHFSPSMRQSGSSDSRRLHNLPAQTPESQVRGQQRPESRLSSQLDRDSRPIYDPVGLHPATEPAAAITRPEGSIVTSETDQSDQRPYRFPPNDRRYHAFPVFSVPQPQIGYQGKFPPNTGGSAASSTAKLSIPTVDRKRKRRGAPRAVMFPNAPSSNSPLSTLAKVDNEEVLRSFPEHLSIPEVMRRFVRPNGAKNGGWQTRKMVDYLLEHENERDHKDILEKERRANVSRWVIKERDSCNNKIRKELGIAKKTAKTSLTVQLPSSSTSSAGVPNHQQITLQAFPAHPAPAYSQNGYSATPYSQDGYPSSVQNAFSTASYPQNQYFTPPATTGSDPSGYGRSMSGVPYGLNTPETSQDRSHRVVGDQGAISDTISPSGSGLQGSLLNTPFMTDEWRNLENADGDADGSADEDWEL